VVTAAAVVEGAAVVVAAAALLVSGGIDKVTLADKQRVSAAAAAASRSEALHAFSAHGINEFTNPVLAQMQWMSVDAQEVGKALTAHPRAQLGIAPSWADTREAVKPTVTAITVETFILIIILMY